MEDKNIKELYKFFNEIVDNLVIPNLDIKHSIERKVQHTFRVYVAWIYDINFDYSIEYIVNNYYIPRLISSLPQNEEIDNIFAHINDFVRNKLKFKS